MAAPRTILLLNCQPIGDTIFASPVPRLLKRAYPDAAIDMIVDRRVADLVRHNPFLDHVRVLDAKTPRKTSRWLRALADIRRARYDMALNLSRNEGYSILAAFSGAKRRCGFSVRWLCRRFPELIREFPEEGHRVDANVEILRRLAVPVAGPYAPEIWTDDISRQRADDLWTAAGLDDRRPVVAVNAGAGKFSKRWAADRFAALTDHLQRENITPVFVGGPGDVPLVNGIAARMSDAAVSFAGKTSLLELAALLRKSRLLVSGDTGPMHIASAMKVPTVALFGPTDAARYGPYGVPNRIVRADLPTPRPDAADPQWMRAIEEPTVFDAVTALLAAAPASKCDGGIMSAGAKQP